MLEIIKFRKIILDSKSCNAVLCRHDRILPNTVWGGANVNANEKLTVRWDDERIKAMAERAMKEEGFINVSDYIRAAIVRDRFLAGDKDAKAIVTENFWKWWRGKRATPGKVKLVLE